jgi:Zn-dependent protease with chaperone function
VTSAIWLGVFAAPVWIALLAYVVLMLRMPRGGLMAFAFLFAIGFAVLARMAVEAFIHAYVKTNGVRTSETQYPDLHAAVENFSSRLGIHQPDVYVMQSSLWNAFAAKFAGRRVVVLLSGAVDSVLRGGRREDLGFLLGHELGHHALGHLDWAQRLLAPGSWFVPVAFWHRRRMELSCDRIALTCAGDLELATRAIVNMTVGSCLAAETDVAEAIRQWEQHRGEFFVKYRTVYSLYPHHLWRLAELKQAAIELDVAFRR